jgi:hypothetical protein
MNSDRPDTAREETSETSLSSINSSQFARARNLTEEQNDEAGDARSVVERVGLCYSWMVRGWYLKGRTDKALAEVWGVAVPTVWGYSSEALRLFKRELIAKSRDELLAELIMRIGAIGQDALERTEEVLSDGVPVEVRRPDHRTALRAAEATGELLGLKIQRHHHVVSPAELTTDQIVAQLEAQGVKVQMPLLEATAETVSERAGTAQGEANGDEEKETE